MGRKRKAKVRRRTGISGAQADRSRNPSGKALTSSLALSKSRENQLSPITAASTSVKSLPVSSNEKESSDSTVNPSYAALPSRPKTLSSEKFSSKQKEDQLSSSENGTTNQHKLIISKKLLQDAMDSLVNECGEEEVLDALELSLRKRKRPRAPVAPTLDSVSLAPLGNDVVFMNSDTVAVGTTDRIAPTLNGVYLHPGSDVTPTVDFVDETNDDGVAVSANQVRNENTVINSRERIGFANRSDGRLRSINASRVAKSRAVRRILDSIKRSGVNDEQRSEALRSAVTHAEVADMTDRIGMLNNINDSKAHHELSFCLEQMRKIVKEARKTNKTRGRPTDAKELFVENIFTGIVAGSTDEKRDYRRPGFKRLAALFDQPVQSVRSLVRRAERKRSSLFNQQNPKSKLWSQLACKERRSHSRIQHLVPSVVEWIKTHPNVIPSPQTKDTLLINGQRVGKLLLEISVRELHNNMIEDVDKGGLSCVRNADGKVLVSDTSFRKIIKKYVPELRSATDSHKQMCGCEVCVVSRLMFISLNSWRKRHYKTIHANACTQFEKLEATQYCTFVQSAPTKPSEAIKEVLCQPVEECNNHYKWPCVLRKCNSCPTVTIDPRENKYGNDAPRINFNFYVSYHKCSIHRLLPSGTKICPQCKDMPEGSKVGKVRSDKKLEVLNVAIGTFMNEYYSPMIEKCAYHRPHVRMLSRKECGAMRQVAHIETPYSFSTSHDYTERLTPNFDFEIQGDHFSKDRSLSMEGYGVSVFNIGMLSESIEDHVEAAVPLDQFQSSIEQEYHSFFSDDSKQDAVTTHSNMHKLFKTLIQRGVIKRGSVNWDDTDGCAKQYRCATALYMLTMLAVSFHIVIDRAIGAPGHGKSEIDGLMAVDKVFLRSLFRTIIIPEAREGANRFSAATVVEGKETSLATQCVLACRNPTRINGVKSHRKYKKRDELRVIKKRSYYESKRSDVQCQDFKAVVTNGFDTGPRNGLSAMYNICADLELGVGKIAVCRIPCACNGCLSQLKLPIYKRYVGACTECKYHSVFFWTNNWRLIELQPKESCPDKELEEVKTIVLDAMTESTEREIEIGNIGSFSTEDPTYEGFYLVEWLSEPFKAEEDHFLSEYDPPMFVKKGECLAHAKYLDIVPRAANWWTPIDQTVTVRLQQVLLLKIQLLEQSNSNAFPRTCSQRVQNEAIRLGAKKLSDEDRQNIIHQILFRSVLDFEEHQEINKGYESDDTVDLSNDDSDSSEGE